MNPIDRMRLMQLHDGELSAAEAATLERALADDPVASAELEGLAQLGGFLRQFGELQGEAAGDLTAAVMERLEREGPRSAVSSRRPSALGPRVPWRGIAAVVGGLAFAATVAMLWSPAAVAPVREPVAVASLPLLPAGPTVSSPTALEPGPEVTIEAVDFGTGNGTIFMVSSGEAGVTPVVWVMDQPPPPKGQVTAL